MLILGFSVFQAVDIENHQVAACKLIYITDKTTDKDRKTVDKEMKIHAALKHRNVLEFISAVVVEPKYKHHYVPGIYMLLEFAAGGDLFDKIGQYDFMQAVASCIHVCGSPRCRYGRRCGTPVFQTVGGRDGTSPLSRVRSCHSWNVT